MRDIKIAKTSRTLADECPLADIAVPPLNKSQPR